MGAALDQREHMRAAGRYLGPAGCGASSVRPGVLVNAFALLLQEGQYALGNLVRLGHHRGPCLLQDLRA